VSSAATNGRIEVFRLAADGSLRPKVECTRIPGEEVVRTEPSSERRKLQNPKAFVIKDGVLYVEERARRRITAFRLLPDGNFEEPTENENGKKKWQPAESKTARLVNYEGLELFGTRIFASQFFKGRIDAYLILDDGRIRSHPTRSEEDLSMSPVRMTTSPDGVLYVAAGVLDRVIAYRLDPSDGELLSHAPFSETAEQDDSFPNDVAFAVLEDGCG
jgi:6-phosphogluconolactonase (cycloisomerase 2 family)